VPTDESSWRFYIISSVIILIIGGLLGLGVNLITPKVKETGEGWFQKRRLKKEKYRAKLERASHDLDTDPTIVYLYFVGLVLLLVTGFALLGIAAIIMAVIYLYFESVVPPADGFIRIMLIIAGLVLLAAFVVAGSYFAVRWMGLVAYAKDLYLVHSDRKRAERKARKEAEVENDQEEMID
jgi:MFS family permease